MSSATHQSKVQPERVSEIVNVLTADSVALTKAGGRGQEAVFVTGIYAPLPKLFALRRGFRPDFFDNSPLVTSNFPLFRGGTLNNINGTITDLGGASFLPTSSGSLLGLNQLEQFSLMHFQVIGKGSSNLIINVDLSQTNFADGTLGANDPTNPSQLIQIVPIVPANNTVTIPEPSLNIGLFILLVVIAVLKKQYAKRV